LRSRALGGIAVLDATEVLGTTGSPTAVLENVIAASA